ncbi:hypothetical protein LINGRAHAP2_LOCUS32478, partial [Linum grandiflorum]
TDPEIIVPQCSEGGGDEELARGERRSAVYNQWCIGRVPQRAANEERKLIVVVRRRGRPQGCSASL